MQMPLSTNLSSVEGPILSLRGIGKRYGPVEALRPLDLDVLPGQIVALIGENGAGKSTLMKIVAGAETPTSGTITFAGAAWRFGSPREARKAGISIVYQEHALLYDMTVAENLFIGRPLRAVGGLIDIRAMRAAAQQFLTTLGVEIDAERTVDTLTMAERQIIEIARALIDEARLIILDEPTAALEKREREKLFLIMRDLAAKGVAILFCSHHLDEVVAVAERTIVLRDGQLVENLGKTEISPERIIHAMIGGALREHYPKEAGMQRAEALLAVTQLSLNGAPGFDLTLAQGEILGIAGLDGSGRELVARALFGLTGKRAAQATRFEIDGKATSLPQYPGMAVALGVGFLPADRKVDGIFADQSVSFNASIAALGRFVTCGWLRARREADVLVGELTAVALSYSGLDQEARALSGGNQQKVMLARWLARRPKVLLCEEPTRGIDVRARTEIYRLIGDFVASGRGVVLMSSDTAELAGICDRVMVFYRGRVVAILQGQGLSEEAIARHAYSEVA